MRVLLVLALAAAAYPVGVSGQVLVHINRGDPEAACLKEGWSPRPKDIEAGSLRVEKGIQAYLKLAAAGDTSKWYVGSKKERHWALDGMATTAELAHDPWASRVARLERIAFITSNNRIQYRALWRAFAGDGTELGIYDAYMQAGDGGARLLGLDLFSPASSAKPLTLTPFCMKPGDVEAWNARRTREAEAKAAN